MRRKIHNPYDPSVNRCFACSRNNPIGLRLEFEESDNFLHASWQPTENYQGYANVLHGGIIATLLDETGAWCVNVKKGTAGLTSELKVRYLKPVFINRGLISLRASIISSEGRNVTLKCELFDGKGTKCAEADSVFFTYPEEIAKRKFGFPGRDKFLTDETV